MVCEEGVSFYQTPLLKAPQKRGDTPPSPLFWGGPREPGTQAREGDI